MIDQDYVDNISIQIADKIELLQIEMVRDLRSLSKDVKFKSIDEFLLVLDELDLEKIVRLKAKQIINIYDLAHTQMLTDLEMYADITEVTLRALTNYSTSTFADSLGSMGSVFKRELVKGALSGATEKGILQAIQQQAGLSNRQMRTLITTGLTDYSRSVGKIMMDNSPAKTRFRYVGAIDNKTRDLCLRIWRSNAMTKSQIIKEFGYDVLVSGGGFNCRHEWVEIGIEDKSKDFREKNVR